MRSATKRRYTTAESFYPVNLRDSKRSKKSSTSLAKRARIEDLPEGILVEILVRIPQASALQCKLVSKSWFILMSSPYFAHRFEQLQPRLLIFPRYDTYKDEFICLPKRPPMLIPFSLGFVPCRFKPVVVGTYKDLVCCCGSHKQGEYYVCNPYTKKYVALPSAPRSNCENVRVGFICTSSSGDVDQYCYRYKVVRIIPTSSRHSFVFYVEIYSSETREWTESRVLSPKSFSLCELAKDAGVAHNGKLYWWGHDFIIGFDPFSNDDRFGYIAKPDQGLGTFNYLGVCRGGRLRACQFMPCFDDFGISIWELEDDGVEGSWSLVGMVYFDQMISENPIISEWEEYERRKPSFLVHDFDPNNDDILYLELFEHLVMCNIRTKTLKEVRDPRCNSVLRFNTVFPDGKRVFPLVIPWFPRPVNH